MKLDNRRLYTYPVLADGRDDYKTCKFIADVAPSFDAANNLRLEIFCQTDCEEINRLIASGDAEYLLHVECPSTIYREVTTRSVENFSCTIPLDFVKKEVDITAFVVLRRDVKNFFCDDWNEDFSGLDFSLSKGSVLAYQNFQPLVLPDDANIFKNVGSIFSVYKKIVGDNDMFDIELSSDKIKIGLNAKDYVTYRRYCSRPELQPILNAMIILPTLVYVFEELKADTDFDVYGEKHWFLSLKAAYRRQKIDLAEYLLRDEKTSLELAQEVMSLPLSKALDGLNHVFDAEDS